MSHTNMKRVELKRIVEFLWKGSPAEEKTPFASQGAVPDNGSFSKNSEADDNKKAAKEFPEDGGEIAEGPMSISRKVCFAMSFNLWILYFLVLGWLLPCGKHDCELTYPGTLEKILPNVLPITKLEPVNGKGLPSLAMLGYSDGRKLKLAALATFDATFEWNNTLPFVPEKIQCNFQNVFDANGDGIPDCLLSGFSNVYAFNASDGHVFWHQSLESEEGDIRSGFHPTAVWDGETYLIGTSGDKLVFLNAKTGNKTLEVDLPCFSLSDIKIVSNSVDSNSTMWYLVCDYGDKVEAWSFGGRDLLSGGNSENNASDFALLFSGSSFGESIALGYDVKPIPGGPLLLSWSDRVAMVTRESTAWEQHVPYPLTVTSVAVGSFSVLGNEAAAAVLDDTDSTIIRMNLKDGIIFNSVKLANRKVQFLDTVHGDRDILILKSIVSGNSSHQTSNSSETQTHFGLIDFHSTPIKFKEIANETEVVDFTLNKQTNGETDLLVLKKQNGVAVYKKYVIHGSKTTCHKVFEL